MVVERPTPWREAYLRAQERIDKARARNAKTLSLSRLGDLRELPPLGGLTELRELYLYETSISDLSPLAELKKLRVLNVPRANISDLSLLPNLPDLRKLYIPENPFSDISSLQRFTNLRELTIAKTAVEDITVLSHLTNIRDLDLSNTKIADFSTLSNLNKLVELNVSDTGFLDLDLQRVSSNIERLYLSNTGIKQIDTVKNLVKLLFLSLSSTLITDISALSKLSQLKYLFLSGTRIANLADLSEIISLRTLSLSKTRVQDLSPIEHLTHLTWLDCSQTKIVDLVPLRNLHSLESLNASKTNITSIEPIGKLKSLNRLDIGNTLVTHLGPLAEAVTMLSFALRRNTSWYGIDFSNCPIDDRVISALAKNKNPERTIKTIAYLRKQRGMPDLDVDLSEFLDSRDFNERVPPPPPPQGAGTHFVVREDGVVDFAPPDSIDKSGNNLPRLRELHPIVKDLASELLEKLDRGNVPYGELRYRAESFLRVVDKDLLELSFARIYVEGVRLQNALSATKEMIEEGTLPDFEPDLREVVESTLRVHGAFILSTGDGLELIAAEQRYQRNPVEEREFREAAIAFGEELLDQPTIVDPEAARFILNAAEELDAGPNPERSIVIGSSAVRNISVVVIAGATIASVTVAAGLVIGVPGTIVGTMAALVGIEGLKKSRAFGAVSGEVTKRLDDVTDGDFLRAIGEKAEKLRPYLAFALKSEATLRRLAGERGSLQWINASLNWLKRNSEEPPS